MSPKAVILGANGQLGRAMALRWPTATTLTHEDLDITDRDAVLYYNWQDYDVIVNAAAYTKVDDAETQEGSVLASKVNGRAPAFLAEAATLHGITLVHVSTDYVFDGTVDKHRETEKPSPLSVYGRTKTDGDRLASRTAKHYVVRTSWVVGDGPNFVRTMAMLAHKGVSPTVVADQIGRLTFTNTLADGIAHLVETQAPYGTYNLSNGGSPTSWAEITRLIFQELGRDPLDVTSTTTAEYFADKPNAAKRPLMSVLELTKIQSVGFDPPDWHVELKEYLSRL